MQLRVPGAGCRGLRNYSDIGGHAIALASRAAVGEEAGIVPGAVRRCGNRFHTESTSLGRQDSPDVEGPFPRFGSPNPARLKDFAPHFIARCTNADSTMN